MVEDDIDDRDETDGSIEVGADDEAGVVVVVELCCTCVVVLIDAVVDESDELEVEVLDKEAVAFAGISTHRVG